MASRVLTWYVEQPAEDSTEIGPVFILDRDYTLLGSAVRLHARKAPDGGFMSVDIQDDGATIFPSGSYPGLQKNRTAEDEWDSFRANTRLDKYSVMTLRLRNGAGARGLTVCLELEALEDDRLDKRDRFIGRGSND